MDNGHKDVKRSIIREHKDMLLVQVDGLFMGKYPTTGFEFWNSKEAYNQDKRNDGNKIFCSNWAVSEETALKDWDRIINKS